MSVTKEDLHREQIAHAETLRLLETARAEAASAKRELDAEKKAHANTRRLLDERTAWHNAARRAADPVTIAAQAARISLLERELVAAGVEVPQ